MISHDEVILAGRVIGFIGLACLLVGGSFLAFLPALEQAFGPIQTWVREKVGK